MFMTKTQTRLGQWDPRAKIAIFLIELIGNFPILFPDCNETIFRIESNEQNIGKYKFVHKFRAPGSLGSERPEAVTRLRL